MRYSSNDKGTILLTDSAKKQLLRAITSLNSLRSGELSDGGAAMLLIWETTLPVIAIDRKTITM